MARQSLSPMRNVPDVDFNLQSKGARPVGRKRKDAPMTHLKYLRKRSGYTLETLSEITSISISYLSRLESGSRRLNTDLIRRLSHAFGCDSSELLQEVSHESQVVTPVEFGRRRRMDMSVRDQNMPVYQIVIDKDNPSICSIELSNPHEWCTRPTELCGRSDTMALRVGSFFMPNFDSTSTLFIELTSNLTPESTVLILKNGEIMVKKIWSITPTSLQVCDIEAMESLKSGSTAQQSELMEIGRSVDIKVYKVVGHSAFDLS
jgi:transcriptional regulator with XRE-family HTH domain